MLKKLLAALEPPKAFASGKLPFWDDEHISKQMLAAHLDANSEGASRKPDFIACSAQWIAALVPPAEYPRLLDLGCGPGLYAEHFARAGYQTTGIDLSARSITWARQQAERAGLAIEYRQQSYLALDEQDAYDVAVMLYCDYGALSPQNRGVLLRNACRALRAGGRLLLDVFTPAKWSEFKEEQYWKSCPQGGFWSEEPHLLLQSNRRYSGCVSLEQTTVLLGGGTRNYYIWNQYFTQEQLAQEAQAAGFCVRGWFGDVAGASFDESSPTTALWMEKA